MDRVGTRIWQLIVEERSLARVLETMLREYEVDREALEHDLLELGRQLCARGLGEVSAEP